MNSATNACECATGFTWDGMRCVPPTDNQVAGDDAAVAPPVEPEGGAGVATAPPVAGRESDAVSDESADSDSDKTAELARRCLKAKGTWMAKDRYCHCSGGGVLVGQRCRQLQGDVTDDACTRALYRGRWRHGECQCEPGLVFSPARGGCVPKVTDNVAILRRVCESSLNRGKWDARDARCQCPPGRVWHDELCQVQERLSSKMVCESDFHRGQWQAEEKRCECRPGSLWIDQSCKPHGNVSPEAACESEANRGVWSIKMSRCLCPGLGRWDSLDKRCKA